MRCPLHPEYRGADMPPAHCVDCWLVWITGQSEQYARIELGLAHRPAGNWNKGASIDATHPLQPIVDPGTS